MPPPPGPVDPLPLPEDAALDAELDTEPEPLEPVALALLELTLLELDEPPPSPVKGYIGFKHFGPDAVGVHIVPVALAQSGWPPGQLTAMRQKPLSGIPPMGKHQNEGF